MTVLLPEQAEALRDLHRLCRRLGIDIVVIGAIALRVWIVDEDRTTEDVDVVVALDVDEMSSITRELAAREWRDDSSWEPRWVSPQGARVDLLPIGRRALREGRILWPRAGTDMRVVGYDRVLKDSVSRELEPRLEIRVAPLHLLALLKMVAYLDAPERRAKDLGDLLTILDKYEDEGERRFSDDVLDAQVQYDEAGAFLLGRDLRRLCSAPDELDAIRRFMQDIRNRGYQVPLRRARWRTGDEEDAEKLPARWFSALARGFGGID